MRRVLFIFLCALTSFAGETAQPIANLTIPYNGSRSSTILSLTTLGDLAYFITIKDNGDSELWLTDGTPDGTHELLVEGQSLRVKTLKLIHNVLYFTTYDHLLGYISAAGVPVLTEEVVLEDLYDAGDGVLAWLFGDYGDRHQLVHFSAADGADAYPVFVPEGSGVRPTYSDPIVYKGLVYVMVGGQDGKLLLMATDGTPGGTDVVTTLFSAPDFTGNSLKQTSLAVSDGHLFLAANYTTSDSAQAPVGSIWISDGTSRNTHALENQDGLSGFKPVFFGLTAYEDGVVYGAVSEDSVALHFTNASGYETLEATRSSFIARITPVADGLVFFNETGFQRLDGRTEVTPLFLHSYSKPNETEAPLQADEDGLFHIITGVDANYWVSDATAAGTELVAENDQVYVAGEFLSINPALVNDHLVFAGANLEDGHKGLVSRSNSDDWQGINVHLHVDPSALKYQVATLGNRTIYFDYPSLRSSTGDLAHTELLATGNMQSFTVVGDLAYFWKSNRTTYQEELWVTDGTPAHTQSIAAYDFGSNGFDMTVSENLLYYSIYEEGKTLIWRTNGTSEGTVQVGTYEDQRRSYEPAISKDGSGGLYYVQYGNEQHHIWHINNSDTSMTLMGEVPRYSFPLGFDLVVFEHAAGRTWMKFVERSEDPEFPNESYHVFTSNGTAEGTHLYAEGVTQMSEFRERNGMASFTMTINGNEGYVLTSGEEPFTQFSATPSEGQIDGFDYRETGTRYGLNETNKLWVNDGTSDGTRTLLTLPEGLKPYLRLDTDHGTVLVLVSTYDKYRAFITNGTTASTRQLFSEDLDVAQVTAFAGDLYVTRPVDQTGDHKLYRLSANNTLELAPGGESLNVLDDLVVTDSNLYFYGINAGLEISLLSIGSAPVAPELVLSYKRKFLSQLFYEVSVAPIEGASYAWTTDGGSLFQPSSSPSVLVLLDRSRKARVSLTATLADGSTVSGELLISGPVINHPGPIIFKR